LAYISIEKLINEYRMRNAVKAHVEGKISLGKAAEVAGTSKREFMAMIEDFGIPFNIGAHDLVKGFGILSGLKRYGIGEKR
jgi:predicted HTH domain antitoxin